MVILRKLLLSVVSVASTIVALLLATFVGGPAIRAVVGIPPGFREDFTSPAAFRQAIFAQAILVSVAFFVLGIASTKLIRTPRYIDAIWIANPIAVGFGFALYKMIYHALYPLGYLPEYDSPLALVILSLAAPVVFAGCFYLGTIRLQRKG